MCTHSHTRWSGAVRDKKLRLGKGKHTARALRAVKFLCLKLDQVLILHGGTEDLFEELEGAL